MDTVDARLLQEFPRLRNSAFSVSSPEASSYNCIAWAIGSDNTWWSPIDMYYWPPNCPRKETTEAYVAAFAAIGFEICDNREYEVGYQKIALYIRQSTPTHAAKQLPNGKWSSKLGSSFDIEHQLEGLEGHHYGKVAMFFRRHV